MMTYRSIDRSATDLIYSQVKPRSLLLLLLLPPLLSGQKLTHLLSTPLNPFPGIFLTDTSAYLQLSRPRSQCFSRRLIIARTKHDDVRALEVGVAV